MKKIWSKVKNERNYKISNKLKRWIIQTTMSGKYSIENINRLTQILNE